MSRTSIKCECTTSPKSQWGKNTSSIRFLHNIINAPNVSIYLDDELLIANLSYKEITAYLNVKSYKHIISVKVGDAVIVEETVCLQYGGSQTFVVAGSVNTDPPVFSLLNFEDNLDCPNPGYFNLRFLHVAYGVPAVDIYVGDKRVFTDVKYPHSGRPEYLSLKLGQLNDPTNPQYYLVSVKLAGTNTVVIGPIPIYFISGGIYTIFATGAVGDNLSAILSHDNPNECDTLKEDFNTEKYMGKWYQIASIPQFFDTDCVRSTAQYTLLQDKVNVYNTCYQIGGTTRDITGEASAPNPCIPAALRVTFPSFPPGPPGPNYLVHATNYIEYAVVGSPSRVSLFILARESTMSERKYKNVLKYVKTLGYNVNSIKADKGAVVDY
jgi:apolipoprotein D and lipocalin family protein